MMGACLDYTALPVIAELLGILDVETLLLQLCLIRDFKSRGD